MCVQIHENFVARFVTAATAPPLSLPFSLSFLETSGKEGISYAPANSEARNHSSLQTGPRHTAAIDVWESAAVLASLLYGYPKYMK